MAGQRSFSVDVGEWVRQTEQRMTAVFRESSQRVIEDMQTPVGAGGNMPVDTGFLRASLQVTTEGPLPGTLSRPGTPVAYTDVAALAIAGAALGDTLYATYTANYASAQEYGSNGREGRGFVRLAAQKWPQIVTTVAAELQARVQGSAGGV